MYFLSNKVILKKSRNHQKEKIIRGDMVYIHTVISKRRADISMIYRINTNTDEIDVIYDGKLLNATVDDIIATSKTIIIYLSDYNLLINRGMKLNFQVFPIKIDAFKFYLTERDPDTLLVEDMSSKVYILIISFTNLI